MTPDARLLLVGVCLGLSLGLGFAGILAWACGEWPDWRALWEGR